MPSECLTGAGAVGVPPESLCGGTDSGQITEQGHRLVGPNLAPGLLEHRLIALVGGGPGRFDLTQRPETLIPSRSGGFVDDHDLPQLGQVIEDGPPAG